MKMINYILPVLILASISFMFASFFKSEKVEDLSSFSGSIYDYPLLTIDGEEYNMDNLKGKKVLIVNVASKCGYTYQYEGLQKLSEKYIDKLVVLGFPANDFLWQEPAKNNEIKEFCSLNYGVSFPMFEKSSVKKGEKQNPLYTWLSNKKLNGWNDSAPSWNFCKYLIDENGKLVDMFSSKVKPFDDAIVKHLNLNE